MLRQLSDKNTQNHSL